MPWLLLRLVHAKINKSIIYSSNGRIKLKKRCLLGGTVTDLTTVELSATEVRASGEIWWTDRCSLEPITSSGGDVIWQNTLYNLVSPHHEIPWISSCIFFRFTLIYITSYIYFFKVSCLQLFLSSRKRGERFVFIAWPKATRIESEVMSCTLVEGGSPSLRRGHRQSIQPPWYIESWVRAATQARVPLTSPYMDQRITSETF